MDLYVTAVCILFSLLISTNYSILLLRHMNDVFFVQTSKIWMLRSARHVVNWNRRWTSCEILNTKKSFMVSVLIHSAKKRWQLCRTCYKSSYVRLILFRGDQWSVANVSWFHGFKFIVGDLLHTGCCLYACCNSNGSPSTTVFSCHVWVAQLHYYNWPYYPAARFQPTSPHVFSAKLLLDRSKPMPWPIYTYMCIWPPTDHEPCS